MIHNSGDLRAIASRPSAIPEFSPIVAIEAFCDIGVESVILSKKLFDNTQKMVSSAATNKDAKDVGRTMSAFVNSSYRDIAHNAVAVSAIWRRFFHNALAPKASEPQPIKTLAANEGPSRR